MGDAKGGGGRRAPRRRWLMLALFAATSAANAAHWLQFAIIAGVAQRFYGVGPAAINWTSMVFMAAYVPLVFPASWITDKKGLRVAVALGAGLTALGGWLKALGSWPDRFAVAFAGQALVGAAQMFTLGAPARLAALWFPPGQVATACALGVFGNQVGIAVGFVVPPAVVSAEGSPEDVTRELLWLHVALAAAPTLLFLLILFLFEAAPPSAPAPEVEGGLGPEHLPLRPPAPLKEPLPAANGGAGGVSIVAWNRRRRRWRRGPPVVRRVAAGAGVQPRLRAAVVRVRAERGRVLRGVDAAQPDAAGALPGRGGGRRARGAGHGGGRRGRVRGRRPRPRPLAPLQAHHAAGVRAGAGRPARLRLRPALRQPRRRLRLRRAARLLHHRVPGRGLRVRGGADAGRGGEHVVGHAERRVRGDGHRAHAGRRGAAGVRGRPPHQPRAHRRPRAGLPAVGARARRRPARARRCRRWRRRRRRQGRRRGARAAGAPGKVFELICWQHEDWLRMRELP